jgi:glucose dehydrogenase
MADKFENFIYVPVCKRCYETHPNPVTYSVGRSGEVLTVEKVVEAVDEEDGETLSSTEEMSSDSDVEMTDSFIVDDDEGIPDSDDSYELSDDDCSSS